MRRLLPHRSALPGTLILAAALAGCDSLLSTEREFAENARVVVTGNSPIPLKLVLSNQFVAVPDPTTGQVTISLVLADTVDLALPIERTYPLGDGRRILVRLINTDGTQDATVRMRVFLDDDEVYNEQAILRNAYLEYTFSYQ